jgi:hypothetical protein
LVAFIVVLTGLTAFASGPAGIFALIEKVVLEPNEQSSERIQIWGAFAFYYPRSDRILRSDDALAPQRGYLYFKLPTNPAMRQAARVEWMDLKAVAGTGQGVAFGLWGTVGNIENLEPRLSSENFPYFITAEGNTRIWLRKTFDPKAEPAVYSPNIGVVKLSNTGWEIIQRLKETR